MKKKVIAFVGNPNVGKSSWINQLSDAHFQVGNWPGVTIEKKEATIEINGQSYYLIDLPGIYSLDEMNNEEAVTAKYLYEEKIDCLVNVVDANNLSRNLLLTMKLRELNLPIILIFNFMDEVRKNKIEINEQAISQRLSIPVYSGSAFNQEDIEPIKKLIAIQANKEVVFRPLLNQKEDTIFTSLYNEIQRNVPFFNEVKTLQHVYGVIYDRVYIMKQLENMKIKTERLLSLRGEFDQDCLQMSYAQAVKSCMNYVTSKNSLRYELSEKIDQVLLHPILSYPILILIFIIMMLFVFHGSAPYIDFIQQFFFEYLANYVRVFLSFLPVSILDLLVNGILYGIGSVLSFLPLMAFLFFFLGLLEESGYMSRIAFLLDKGMRLFNLSGKAFLNLLIGFGCNVPAISATRTLENPNQRKLTAILIPFMSCSARLPVYLLFASAFFPNKISLAILSVVGMGVLLAIILATLNTYFKVFNDYNLFILELPVYRVPRIKVLLQKVKKEVVSFISKAFTIVLLTMTLLWGFTYFPNGEVQTSYLAQAAQKVSFIFEPAGFGESWEVVAAIPSGISAKESVVGFLSQLIIEKEQTTQPVNLKKDLFEQGRLLGEAFINSIKGLFFLSDPIENDPQLTSAISSLFTGRYASAKAFSYMVFICLSIPCVMTLIALKREFGWKMMSLSILIMTITPYVVCVILYQALKLLFTFL